MLEIFDPPMCCASGVCGYGDGIAARGRYPTRRELAALVELSLEEDVP